MAQVEPLSMATFLNTLLWSFLHFVLMMALIAAALGLAALLGYVKDIKSLMGALSIALPVAVLCIPAGFVLGVFHTRNRSK